MTLDEWIIKGETGVSSKTMWAAIKGAVTDGTKGPSGFDVPYDVGDFRRCLLFVVDCGITEAQLQKVKEVFPWWAPFIDNWDDLARNYKEGTLQYERIKELELQSRKLAGWKQVSPYRWEFQI